MRAHSWRTLFKCSTFESWRGAANKFKPDRWMLNVKHQAPAADCQQLTAFYYHCYISSARNITSASHDVDTHPTPSGRLDPLNRPPPTSIGAYKPSSNDHWRFLQEQFLLYHSSRRKLSYIKFLFKFKRLSTCKLMTPHMQNSGNFFLPCKLWLFFEKFPKHPTWNNQALCETIFAYIYKACRQLIAYDMCFLIHIFPHMFSSIRTKNKLQQMFLLSCFYYWFPTWTTFINDLNFVSFDR